MKKIRLTATICLMAMPLTAAAESLAEVYRLALDSDPQLREADANRLAVMESKPQARSGLLPNLSFAWDEGDSSSDGSRSQFVTVTQDGAQTTSFIDTPFDEDSDDRTLTLTLTQSVFRWDRWVTLRQSDRRIAQAEVDFEIARQDLLLRVAQRYFDVLAAEDTLEFEQANKEAIARQLEQAETRFEVGLIAITDVQESRAAYDRSVASEIDAKRILAVARENLREVTGAYIEQLASPGERLPLVAPNPESPDSWVDRALDQNLALVSSRLGAEIARDTIDLRRANHLPTLDLVFRRTEFEQDVVGTQDVPVVISDPITGEDEIVIVQRPSDRAFDTADDTISLQFRLPLYQGGRTGSEVRQAVQEHRAAKERLERVARETERQTRDSYLGVIAEVARVRALEQALESTATALRATEAGFEVGTRTTVDVLDARRDLFQAQTNLARSRYDYILNVLRLKQAAGTLTDADVNEVDGWLDDEEAGS